MGAKPHDRPDDCILETERLWLCRPDPGRDLRGWTETMGEAENVRFIGGKTLGPVQSWRQMATVLGHFELRGYGFMSAITKAAGEHVGRIGPWFPHGWPEPEIGWTLHPRHHGLGYATEAGRACLQYVWDELEWTRVVHVIQVGNTASAAVARRLGSTHLRDIDGLPELTTERCWVYGQSRPQRP